MCWLLSCVASTLFSWTETNGSVAATARKKGATPFALALAMASRTTSVTHVTSRSRACRRNTPLPPSSTRSKGITKVVTKGPDLTPFWPPSPFTAFPTSEAEAKAAAKVEAAKSSSIPIKAAPGPLPGTSQAPTTRPGPRAHQSAITSPRQLPRRQSHWPASTQFLPKLQHCQPRPERKSQKEDTGAGRSATSLLRRCHDLQRTMVHHNPERLRLGTEHNHRQRRIRPTPRRSWCRCSEASMCWDPRQKGSEAMARRHDAAGTLDEQLGIPRQAYPGVAREVMIFPSARGTITPS